MLISNSDSTWPIAGQGREGQEQRQVPLPPRRRQIIILQRRPCSRFLIMPKHYLQDNFAEHAISLGSDQMSCGQASKWTLWSPRFDPNLSIIFGNIFVYSRTLRTVAWIPPWQASNHSSSSRRQKLRTTLANLRHTIGRLLPQMRQKEGG